MTLDGFVAGPQGELQWAQVDEELFDYIGKRIQTGDTALYGRKTYQMMEDYWPTAGEKPNATKHEVEHSTWYKNVHKVVLSKSLQGANLKNTTIISDNLADELAKVKQQAGSDILLLAVMLLHTFTIKYNL
jgi:Dihydrofolate reductase